MIDRNRLNIALAKFDAFRAVPPSRFGQDRIIEYHGILLELSTASVQFFDDFKIPDSEMKHKVVGWTRGTSRRRGTQTLSQEKYCDDDFVRRKIEAAASYISSLNLRIEELPVGTDYWAMQDNELEVLARQWKIEVRRLPVHAGANTLWRIDRNYIIGELVRRDDHLGARGATNVVNIGEMHSSNVVQGSSGVFINQAVNEKSEELRQILHELRKIAESSVLNEEQQSQMHIEIGTIEIQSRAPKPSNSIIKECLVSAKNVLEAASGGALGVGLVALIKNYLSLP